VKRSQPAISYLAILAAGFGFLPSSASACAVCFGKSDSALAQGMNMGILSLLVVVVFMWAGFAAFFIYLARRSAAATSGKKSGNLVPEPTNSVR